MVNVISDFGLRGVSSFYKDFTWDSTIKIFGIYPKISGTYPKKGPKTIVLETVVPLVNFLAIQIDRTISGT
jgi:hypothetical protein